MSRNHKRETVRIPSDDSDLFCEFPDPVIARYLQCVRDLPDRRLDWLQNEGKLPPWSWLFPFTWWLTVREAGTAWAMRRLAEAGCRAPDALLQYRRLWKLLVKRGWPRSAQTRVAYGLVALRTRRRRPDAREQYMSAIGAFIPIELLGWADDKRI